MSDASCTGEYGAIVLAIRRHEAHPYVVAARKVRQVLGAKCAVDAETLIRHELGGRTARAIAEEYLYFIGWYEDEARKSPTSGVKRKSSVRHTSERPLRTASEPRRRR